MHWCTELPEHTTLPASHTLFTHAPALHNWPVVAQSCVALLARPRASHANTLPPLHVLALGVHIMGLQVPPKQLSLPAQGLSE